MHIRSTAARSLVAVPTAAALLLLAPAAHAAPGGKNVPGNNGTVKIHDAATGQEDTRNEPKVCTFYLDSFGFDAGQDIIWTITTGHGDDEKMVVYGDLPVDANGDVRTDDINLPDGQYKLYWAAVPMVDGVPSEDDPALDNPKHKVFKVDCGGQNPSKAPTGPTSVPSAPATGKPSEKPSEKPSDKPSEKPSDKPSEKPSDKPSDKPSEKPTGAPTTAPATKPAETPSATAAPTTPAAGGTTTGAPTAAPSSAPAAPVPTATVPVQTPAAGTPVNPAKPLIVPTKASVPTPIKGAPVSDGKKLASTGSDGTLLYAGAGTVLVLGGAALVYGRRTRRSS